MRVSREWRAAALSMASCELVFDGERSNGAQRLQQMLQSPLRRHVSHLRVDLDTPCSTDLLAQFAERMPHLHSLDSMLHITPHAVVFQPQLRSLRLRARPSFHFKGIHQLAIDAAARLQHLTDLTLDRLVPGASYAPLTVVPTLTRLDLAGAGRWKEDLAAQAQQLRALHQLRSLSACVLPLSVLLASPHQLQLVDLTARAQSEADVSALASLPALTRLQLKRLKAPHVDFLHSLPVLTSLHLSFAHETVVDVPRCTAVLQSCARLQELALYDGSVRFTSAQLVSCLERMSKLHFLRLEWCFESGSLSFLSAGCLSTSLTSLYLDGFRQRVPLEEISHINALCNLRHLTLSNCVFTKKLPRMQSRSFKPPSSMLPKLQSYAFLKAA